MRTKGWKTKGRLLAGTSAFTLGLGLVAGEMRLAEAAPCAGGSNQTVTGGSCTGPFTWSGGNLTVNGTGGIGGGAQGVNSVGPLSLGTLSNSGAITGTQDGIYQDSTTGTLLTNTGTITGQGRDGIGLDGIAGTTFGTIRNGAFGTISGARSGLYIYTYSTVSSLINDGTMTSAGTGVYIDNGGTLSALNNAGTISGAVAAIDNELGELGAITNSGTISGNIINNSTSDLVINGGSGSTFGTLSNGTITNQQSDLLFTSGNLWLQDDIDVTGHTLIISSATLKLNSARAVTGNFRQTGGGLLIVATGNGAAYGYLTVSGTAAVSGTRITISGAGLSPGQTFSVIRAGTGAYNTATDTGAVSGTARLSATVSTANGGNDLVVVLIDCPSCDAGQTDTQSGSSGGSSGASQQSGPQTGSPVANMYQIKGAQAGSTGGDMGGTLDRIVAAGSVPAAFRYGVLNVIDAMSTDARKSDAIQQLAPTRAAPAFQVTSGAATAVLGAVEQHQQTVMGVGPVTGLSAGSDEHDSALWGQFLGGVALRGTTAAADGYRTTLFGAAFGLDHRFTDHAMGGIAASWLRGMTRGIDGASGSSTTLDSYQLTFYSTLRDGSAFVDSQLATGLDLFSQSRAIPFLGGVANASYGGRHYLARVLGGYDLPATDTLTVTPLVGLSWLRGINHQYTETDAGAANLSVDRGALSSLTQEVGGKVSWRVDTGLGTFKPEVRLEYIRDYLQAPVATSGLLAGQAFATTTPRPSANGIQLGLAMTLNRNDSVSFRAEYQGEARTKYKSHAGVVKAIWGF